ncbi:MAG TPA: hypothetical protein ENN25_00855 [Euryarchaeota archaeon]|nr:hypothetical protein [Euryarchaeota archaeon]
MLCPSCWGEVDLDILLCPHCGAEFEVFSDASISSRRENGSGNEGLLRIVAIIAISVSVAFLAVTSLIELLHNIVPPLSSNLSILIALALCGILISALLYGINLRAGVRSDGISINRRLAPYVILSLSVFCSTLFVMAETVDSILTRSAVIANIVFMVFLLVGIGLYLRPSSGSERRGEASF